MPGLNKAAIKVVLNGLMSGSQSWSTSFWMAGTIDPLTLDLAQINGELETACQAWGTAFSDYWTVDTKLVGTTLYEYPIGATVAAHQDEDIWSTTIQGSHSTNRLPTFCSMVQTLRTGVSGRSFRGRMYAPLTSIGLGQYGEVGVSELSTMCVATRDMLQAAQDLDLAADGLTAQKCVVASFTKGLTTPIHSVFVDSLVDVQHRREDKIGASAFHTEFIV